MRKIMKCLPKLSSPRTPSRPTRTILAAVPGTKHSVLYSFLRYHRMFAFPVFRCEGKVFEAERMQMRNGAFHKNCFRCSSCSRALDFSLACDGPEGDIFCRNCYLKLFGPQGRSGTPAREGFLKPSKIYFEY